MFTVNVRDHMMVAHSLHGATFGPAQRLHGATYVVDAAFAGPELGSDGVLIDIGAAASLLRDVLGALTYRNLDEEADFDGLNILVIGYSGLDNEVLRLLRESGNTLRSLLIANGTTAAGLAAREAINRQFGDAGVRNGLVFPEGFSEFVESEMFREYIAALT